MKTVTITGIMSDFLDSIRAYEHESGRAITYDERDSSEFVNIFFGDGDFKIEEENPKPLFITEDGVEVHCRNWELFGVEVSTFKRAVVTSKSLNRHSFLLFANKHKADEYIAWYKKEFSINDLFLADVGITTSQLDKLQELAKKG